MNEIEKPHYKIGEVCELTGTQPYVLRFWESEFPGLAPQKNRSGQRIYRKRDIDLIEKIKVLLYEKEYTIAGARKVLETEMAFEEDALTAGASGADGELDPRRARGGRAEPAASVTPTLFPPTDDARKAQIAANDQLEAEVKNLRAKLARAEAELRAILADMDRRDELDRVRADRDQ